MAAPRLVDRPDALEAIAVRLAGARRIALDTEANGFHAYRPRLCLIQLAWDEGGEMGEALVDPLAIPARDRAMRRLGEVLAAPPGPVVLHGGDYDIRLLKRDAEIAPGAIFDTEIAARLAGRSRTGLSSLVEEFTGRRLSKGGQKTDWARRPLPPRALGYAIEDVRSLFVLHDRLRDELARLGRLAWLEEECEALAAVPPAQEPRTDPETLAHRIPGAARLDEQGAATLRALLVWRDKEARRRDVPPVQVLQPRTLARLAELRPRELPGLVRCGVPESAIRRYGRAILAAVARPMPPVPAADRPRTRGRAAGSGALRRLKAVRDRAARGAGLDPGLVLSAACLKRIAAARPAGRDELLAAGARGWQIDLVGEAALLAAARGG